MKKSDPPFIFIGNNPALDFANTELVNRGQLVDLIREKSDFVQWLHAAKLKIDSNVQPSGLSRVLEFRKALKDLFAAQIDGLPAPRNELEVINQHLANHVARQVLRFNKQGYELRPLTGPMTIPILLANLAYEAATLLASPQAHRLKRCNNPDCVLIFLDTSRSQKRRWCSMETCGNRVKAATHYRKNQT